MTVEEYIQNVQQEQYNAFIKLRKVILENIPNDFEECMSYGIIWYVVPHNLYPKWYHCDPRLPLPFLNIAHKSKSINLYHMWIYANDKLYNWFV